MFSGVFSRENLHRIKDGACLINLDDKKVKYHNEFHFLLTDIWPCISILLELNIFRKSIK